MATNNEHHCVSSPISLHGFRIHYCGCTDVFKEEGILVKRNFVHRFRLLIFVLLISFGSFFSLSPLVTQAASAPSIVGLHVSGNQLLNKDNQVIVPVGVGRSGTEYPCIQGWGIFDGPHDDANVTIMTTWQMNAVRISLNETCWLGINGVDPNYSGTKYQQSIINYVNLLNSKNILAIIDLHWNAPGTDKATGQKAMPDLDHSVDLWKSVATTFKANSSVLFELYNEPFTSSWDCWRDGSTAASAAPCTDVNFAVAGMQTLVDAVRSTGATNPILLGGLRWGNNMTGWLDHMPKDPNNSLIAAFHVYNFNQCITTTCWQNEVLPVANKVPMVMTEIGETDCTHTFVDNLMNWADRYNIGYTAWAWSSYGCGYPALLTSVSKGIPSAYGQGVMQHFQALSLAGLKGYGEYSVSGSYFGESRVRFKYTAPLKEVTVTILVQKDVASLAYSGSYSTFDNSKLIQTHAESDTQIEYTFALKDGEVMQPQSDYNSTLFAVQFKTNNEVHSAKKDTFILNGTTTDGQAIVLQGNIDA
jgi:endoglucanase